MSSNSKEGPIPLSGLSEATDRMSVPYDMSWHETSPGVHERDVDELEMFYTSLAKTYEGMGRTYFAITAYIGISIPLPISVPTLQTEQRLETALRKAWKRLRYEYPTLAAPVEYDPSTRWCRKVYQEGEEWLEETFRLVNGQTGLDFANTDPSVAPLATLYLVNPPLEPGHFPSHELRRDVVFRSTHDLIDGIGTLNLLNSLLRHASQAYALQDSYHEPIFGDEHKNLSPPYRIAASLPAIPTTLQSQKFETIQASNQHIRHSSKILSIPFLSSPSSKPGRCFRVATHLTAGQSKALLQKCKDIGVTPTHVFHSGIALGVRDLQEKNEYETKGTYLSYALVNLRETCMTPFNTPLHAASVYHSVSAQSLAVPLTIHPFGSITTGHQISEEFSIVLDQVASFYRDVKIDADYLATVPSLFASKTPPYPKVSSTPVLVPAPNPNPSASLSSMGIIDKIIQPKHGDFTVTGEPWVIGAEYSPGIGVFLGTWKGIIGLSAAYNEAFHTNDEVRMFLDSIKNVVLQGLMIDS